MQTNRLRALLATGKFVLCSRDRNTVVLARHGRWHLVLLGWVIAPDGTLVQGIDSINFLSAERVNAWLHAQAPFMALLPPAAVLPSFTDEVACKILPTASAYRPLFANGTATIGAGATTDTLRTIAASADVQVAMLQTMMTSGEAGPFVAFPRAWTAMPCCARTSPRRGL